MKRFQKLAFSLLSLVVLASCQSTYTGYLDNNTEEDLLSLVDPNIGSVHSRWFFYTPGALPFGMAKPGPSTDGSYGNPNGWEAVGYDGRHESIEGFANLREFQVGGFLFTAMTGDVKTVPGKLENPEEGYRSRFDKKDEYARPGYYSVKLLDYDVTAELTATERVGFHRYTFPRSKQSHVIMDIGNQLGESGKVKDAYVKFNDDGTVEGWVITYPEYVKKYQPEGEIRMYFSAILDKKPISVGVFNGKDKRDGQREASGPGAGIYLTFETDENESVEIKAGFSYTSLENAKKNLLSEASDLTFDQAKSSAQSKWESELGKIQIKDNSKENKVKFYTGLYHALLGRGLASDVNGQFPENDGTIGQIPLDKDGNPKFKFYNTDSVWGAFWNLTQLWSLVWPEYYNDFVQSHLAVYKNSGWMSDGLANSKYVSGVGTNFVGLVIASAYQAGIRDFDLELAFQAAYENELRYEDRNEGAGKTDLKPFVEKGYIPYVPGWDTSPEGSAFSVSHALEYSYSSYAVAQFAKALGKQDEYDKLMSLSNNWKASYDDRIDFVRPKNQSGEFIEDFDPFAPWVGFQEGNAWQYTFYVPHTPEELVNKMGDEKFVSRLDSIFTVSEKTNFGGEDIDAFAGLTYLYNHGNQPNLHISWLFNFTSKPWLTQQWVRRICDTFYGVEEVHGYGFGQDEDQGQLGSWFVMASMGLFDVKGLIEIDPSFQFSSPLFDEIEIKTGNGKKLKITTNKKGVDDVFIQSIKLNGSKYTDRNISLEALLEDSHLEFDLGRQPNKTLY
ncbi:GH92 family glycosyl hydrolase [Belliella sp. DSM 111904]|uniref:GH92 family glycosyl hydrolase n=1 Tax=Belliella filtrata TaxID=2923435 RepID=A0ABS9UY27_9BACT|nr:GH92 family glycosyl hydrolase [Belliella filtrata]MCH7409091.1 GH92 family glycosyl hydrolase [Belliella filtrata]